MSFALEKKNGNGKTAISTTTTTPNWIQNCTRKAHYWFGRSWHGGEGPCVDNWSFGNGTGNGRNGKMRRNCTISLPRRKCGGFLRENTHTLSGTVRLRLMPLAQTDTCSGSQPPLWSLGLSSYIMHRWACNGKISFFILNYPTKTILLQSGLHFPVFNLIHCL